MVVTNMEDNGRKLFCFFLLLLLLFDSPNTDENDVMTDSRRDERHITSGPLSACSETSYIYKASASQECLLSNSHSVYCLFADWRDCCEIII